MIGPSDPGPGPYGTGGEVVIWESGDEGKTWTRARQVTQKSPRNHSYVRIPLNPHPDFYAFWADGDPFAFSESHLYFMNKEGRAFELPYRMKRDFEKPKRLK